MLATICIYSPFFTLEIILPLALAILFYMLVLKGRLNKSFKQRLLAVFIGLVIFVGLAIAGTAISVATGVGCTGPHHEIPAENSY